MYEGIKNIYELLENKRLKEALVQLQAICTQAPDWELRNRIEEAYTTYGYMLQYARQGINDPNRQALYHQILHQVYELTDKANIILQTAQKPGVYFEIQRTYGQRPPVSYSELALRLEAYIEDISTVSILHTDKKRCQTETEKICQSHENALNEMFNKTWASLQWTEAETSEAQHIIDSLIIASNDKAILISAVMMSLMHIFDKRKVHFLLDNCRNEDTQVSQRAIIGLIVALNKYQTRINIYPSILSQLSLLTDNKEFCNHVFTIYLQILMTRETSNITKKMNEDILPNIMKATQMKNNKNLFIELDEEADINPEWEERLNASGFHNVMNEMSNLQQSGADIYMSTFAALKSVPFFNKVSHWFYPFDMNQTDILPITQKFNGFSHNIIALIMHSDTFCSSDKYSFCFTLTNMPETIQKKAFEQLNVQMETTEEQKDLIKKSFNRSKAPKNISRQYLQDLYRFSQIWVNRHPGQEEDLLQGLTSLWKNIHLKPILQRNEYIRDLANFLFHYKRFNDAYELYTLLLERNEETAELHQKVGYIFQVKKAYEEAIGHFLKADLLAPDQMWTLKHLSQCYKSNKQYHEALACYQRTEKIQPDNLGIAQQIGDCLVRLNRYEEALTYFYKVEYLEKDPITARRGIAWCSLCMGKYDDALKYTQILLNEDSPQMQDWLNGGHVYWVNGDTVHAMECYSKAQDLCKSHSEFIRLFNEDKNWLTTTGISEEDMLIMLDLLI